MRSRSHRIRSGVASARSTSVSGSMSRAGAVGIVAPTSSRIRNSFGRFELLTVDNTMDSGMPAPTDRLQMAMPRQVLAPAGPSRRVAGSRCPLDVAAALPRPTYWNYEKLFKSSKTYDLRAFYMRSSGLEPPRTIRSTRPSTLRVYQFRHERERAASISGRELRALPACIRPEPALLYEHMFVSAFNPLDRGAPHKWI
jgi:hypothetical protein